MTLTAQPCEIGIFTATPMARAFAPAWHACCSGPGTSLRARYCQMSQQAVKFAYWVPNVSGGLVVSKIEQRTHLGIDYNRKLAQLAEEAGFEYALTQIRFTAGYGASSSMNRLPSATRCWRPRPNSR